MLFTRNDFESDREYILAISLAIARMVEKQLSVPGALDQDISKPVMTQDDVGLGALQWHQQSARLSDEDIQNLRHRVSSLELTDDGVEQIREYTSRLMELPQIPPNVAADVARVFVAGLRSECCDIANNILAILEVFE